MCPNRSEGPELSEPPPLFSVPSWWGGSAVAWARSGWRVGTAPSGSREGGRGRGESLTAAAERGGGLPKGAWGRGGGGGGGRASRMSSSLLQKKMPSLPELQHGFATGAGGPQDAWGGSLWGTRTSPTPTPHTLAYYERQRVAWVRGNSEWLSRHKEGGGWEERGKDRKQNGNGGHMVPI